VYILEGGMLTKKEIRYAMIKGKNEKKHPELLPRTHQILKGSRLVHVIDITIDKAEWIENSDNFDTIVPWDGYKRLGGPR
jgi:hypothetical protein